MAHHNPRTALCHHCASVHSAFPLQTIFCQKPWLPVDCLLGRVDEEPTSENMEDWVTRHQQHLMEIYLSAKNKLGAAAAYRARNDPDTIEVLTAGMLVYRRNHLIGRCKIQDCWNPKVFEVVEALPQTPTTSVPSKCKFPNLQQVNNRRMTLVRRKQPNCTLGLYTHMLQPSKQLEILETQHRPRALASPRTVIAP